MKKIIFLILFFTSISYSQRVQTLIGYIQDGNFILVDKDNALPVKVEGMSLGDVTIGDIKLDTNAQNYNTKVLLQQAPMNFTKTFSNNVTTTAVALPFNVCRQVDITVDFSYTGTVYIGSTGLNINTGIPLKAGDACTFYVNNTNEIFVLGSEIGTNTLRIKYSGRQ